MSGYIRRLGWGIDRPEINTTLNYVHDYMLYSRGLSRCVTCWMNNSVLYSTVEMATDLVKPKKSGHPESDTSSRSVP